MDEQGLRPKSVDGLAATLLITLFRLGWLIRLSFTLSQGCLAAPTSAYIDPAGWTKERLRVWNT